MLVDIKLTLHQPRKRGTVSCVTVHETVNSFSPDELFITVEQHVYQMSITFVEYLV